MSLPPPPPPPQPPPKRIRTGWIIALIVGAVVALGGCGVLVLVLVAADQTLLTHDLIDADFEETAEPFTVGSFEPYEFALADGTYQMAATEDAEVDGERGLSYAGFARVAYVVDVSAVVVDADLDDGQAIAIGCAETPRRSRDESTFMFVADASGAAIGHADASDDAEDPVIAWDQRTGGIEPGDRIRLRCTQMVGSSDEVELTAFINGEDVLRGTHPARYGGEGFEAMVLGYIASGPGDEARFDDAIAHVPE